MTSTTGAQPGADYFDVMADHVDDHWWYAARRELLAEVLAGRVEAGSVAVDVGCGAGGSLAVLADAGASTIVGTDLVGEALANARTRVGGAQLMASRAERLPLRGGAADVLISLDVIEHLDDDVAALGEYRRVLRPGGTLVLSVPAYPGLWSRHDEWAGHRRRYRDGTLAAAVRSAGLELDRVTHFFSFLVPPAVALRRTPLGRLVSGNDEDAAASPLVSKVLGGAARAERAVLRRAGRLPVGLSLLAVARRPNGR
ncbi:MAG: methyltransferase domain-containing protein [Acidimicrobiia bacterium]|nr:methyltransferase domain-containing protein [Acidimicrobiia bacterium]